MELTQEIVRELLDYDPDTGILTWKPRDRKWFKNGRTANSWNKKFAGKEVTTLSNGYIILSIFNRRYIAHRIIWLYYYGRFPSMIDHIDRNKSNNRICNLRETSYKDNGKNITPHKGTSSPHLGVNWHSTGRKWMAGIQVDGKQHYLGLYFCYMKALKARQEAEKKYGFRVQTVEEGLE